MFLDFAYFSVGLGEDEGGGRVRSSVHASQVLWCHVMSSDLRRRSSFVKKSTLHSCKALWLLLLSVDTSGQCSIGDNESDTSTSWKWNKDFLKNDSKSLSQCNVVLRALLLAKMGYLFRDVYVILLISIRYFENGFRWKNLSLEETPQRVFCFFWCTRWALRKEVVFSENQSHCNEKNPSFPVIYIWVSFCRTGKMSAFDWFKKQTHCIAFE